MTAKPPIEGDNMTLKTFQVKYTDRQTKRSHGSDRLTRSPFLLEKEKCFTPKEKMPSEHMKHRSMH